MAAILTEEEEKEETKLAALERVSVVLRTLSKILDGVDEISLRNNREMIAHFVTEGAFVLLALAQLIGG